jgi:hypothetical protein
VGKQVKVARKKKVIVVPNTAAALKGMTAAMPKNCFCAEGRHCTEGCRCEGCDPCNAKYYQWCYHIEGCCCRAKGGPEGDKGRCTKNKGQNEKACECGAIAGKNC